MLVKLQHQPRAVGEQIVEVLERKRVRAGVTVSNKDQSDFDGDTIGDMCDLCPATEPGATVDGYGCSEKQDHAYADPNRDRATGRIQKEGGCAISNAAPQGWSWVLVLFAACAIIRTQRYFR